MSHTDTHKYYAISLICGILKKKKIPQKHKNRQKTELTDREVGEVGEGGQKEKNTVSKLVVL